MNSSEDTQVLVEKVAPKTIKWWLPALVFVVMILLDQYLKYWVKHNMLIHTERSIIGNWFLFHFTENNGMAFGMELPGKYGKLILSVCRIGVALFGLWYLYKSIKENKALGFLVAVALVLAGAIGNIIDSMFYGVWFKDLNEYSGGYLYGRVVDMLYFPIVETHYPSWSPIKAGQEFIFFSPVFNLADTAVSTGIITIIVFNKKFFPKEVAHEPVAEIASEPVENSELNQNSTEQN